MTAVHALAYPIGGIFHIPHGLKRVLRNRQLQIQAYDAGNRMVVGPLKPKPIELDRLMEIVKENLE